MGKIGASLSRASSMTSTGSSISDVGNADDRVMVGDARNGSRGDALVAYGYHRRLMTRHLREGPRPGAGRNNDALSLDETVVCLDSHHPVVPYRKPGSDGACPDPDTKVLCCAAESPRTLPGVEVTVLEDEVPTLDALDVKVRRQPGHLRPVHKASLHAATVRVLDVLLEGGHPFGREGQQQATGLAESWVVVGLLLEV